MHGIVVQKTVEIPQLQFLDLVVVPVCATTVLVQTVQTTVEFPQVQLLWYCGRHCDHTARSSSPVVRFSAIQSDRVLDIPVVLTVQFLNKVVDMVFTTVPMVRQCAAFIDKVIDIPVRVLSGGASDSVIDRAQ